MRRLGQRVSPSCAGCQAHDCPAEGISQAETALCLRLPGPPENSILLVCLKGGFFVSFSLCVPWVGLTLCRRMSGIVDPVASQVLGACLILQRILQVVRRDPVNILQPALVPLTLSPVTKVLSAHSEQQLLLFLKKGNSSSYMAGPGGICNYPMVQGRALQTLVEVGVARFAIFPLCSLFHSSQVEFRHVCPSPASCQLLPFFSCT